MALALNNLKRVDMPLNKETKPINFKYMFLIRDWVQSLVKSYQILKKKMVLDAALLNTQRYKVRIKGKVAQSKEWSSALPYTSV